MLLFLYLAVLSKIVVTSKKIILAEDHNVVMMGTMQMLSKIKPNAQITCAWDFPEVIELLKAVKYDLLILDINIPGGDQPAMVNRVRKIQPEIFILIFSGYAETLYTYPYMEAGANGFLSKTCTEREFQVAIEKVMGGQIYLSPQMQNQIVDNLLNKKLVGKDGLKVLSAREISVMDLLIKGASTAEIGQRLFLAPSTISTHKMRIFRKLGVSNLVELIEYVRSSQSDDYVQ